MCQNRGKENVEHPILDSNDTAYPAVNGPDLTKREFFAAMAMQGFAADPNFDSDPGKLAIEWADKLIKALNETPPK